jgi:maleate cis-trans isomerase
VVKIISYVWQKIISYVCQIGGFLYGKDYQLRVAEDYQLRVADWWFSLW